MTSTFKHIFISTGVCTRIFECIYQNISDYLGCHDPHLFVFFLIAVNCFQLTVNPPFYSGLCFLLTCCLTICCSLSVFIIGPCISLGGDYYFSLFKINSLYMRLLMSWYQESGINDAILTKTLTDVYLANGGCWKCWFNLFNF